MIIMWNQDQFLIAKNLTFAEIASIATKGGQKARSGLRLFFAEAWSKNRFYRRSEVGISFFLYFQLAIVAEP